MSQKIHPVLARIYASRGIQSSEDLARDLSELIPYQQLANIEHAVQRIALAIKNDEHILIIGDYDADGATSTAVGISALRLFNAKCVDFLVPNRFDFGYGLSEGIVDVAIERKAQLIITVDNGIANIQGVAKANAAGIDVIITDHHLAGEQLPEAYAIVNPNQNHCEFPSKSVAGVGVIFYVMLALRRYLTKNNWFDSQNLPAPNMGQLLDLVALGTIADVVPLDKNNRILAYQGLMRIRHGKARPGIYALLKSAGREPSHLAASDLAFAVAPRLNAAGRLDDMTIGIACLLSTDEQEALQYAEVLQELNQERRFIENEMKQQAFKAIDQCRINESSLSLGLALYDPRWHQGVIGIVAGRVKDRYHRPTIAFANDKNGIIKGSARSVAGVHIRDVLAMIDAQHPSMIIKFGGHAMAAGLSIKADIFTEFENAFNAVLATMITEDDLCAKIKTDGELSANDLNLEFAQLLREAGPWGQAFPEPMFEGSFEIIEQRLLAGKHLKLLLRLPHQTHYYDAIAFNVEENAWPNHRCSSVRIIYRLDVNYFRGDKKLQLCIEQIEPLTMIETHSESETDYAV